jgi:ABC-type branched-subunit amino acid transport system ATPase component
LGNNRRKGASVTEGLLTTRGLSKHFAGLRALDNVDFSLAVGSIRGLIGPNGSGKTTFINLVSGLLPTTAGEVLFNGARITGLAPKDITRLGIARTFQMARVMEQVSCLENVMTGRYCRTKHDLARTFLRLPFTRSKQEVGIKSSALDLLEFVGLAQSAERMASDLVWVERQLLQIARALATEPKLLLLDEPTSGMGETESRNVQAIIEKIRDMGITVILVSHDVKLVARIADYITVINSGTKLAEGPPAYIQCHPDVIEAYLGSEQD